MLNGILTPNPLFKKTKLSSSLYGIVVSCYQIEFIRVSICTRYCKLDQTMPVHSSHPPYSSAAKPHCLPLLHQVANWDCKDKGPCAILLIIVCRSLAKKEMEMYRKIILQHSYLKPNYLMLHLWGYYRDRQLTPQGEGGCFSTHHKMRSNQGQSTSSRPQPCLDTFWTTLKTKNSHDLDKALPRPMKVTSFLATVGLKQKGSNKTWFMLLFNSLLHDLFHKVLAIKMDFVMWEKSQ